MFPNYEDTGEGFQDYMDQEFGDVSQVAWDYARLRYGDENVQENREAVIQLIGSEGLERSDFFETVKNDIDELLSR